MKTILQKLTLFLCVFYCAQITNAQQRSEVEALRLANEFLSKNKSANAKGVLGITSKINPIQIDTKDAFYIYGIDGAKGFVIISGDERMTPVLGYSYSTSFDAEKEIPENVRYWLSIYEKEYQLIKNGEMKSVQRYSAASHSNVPVSPIVSAEWGQDSPYNNNCPSYNGSKCVTGCVATAMGQIMNAFKYPDCGKGSITYTTDTKKIKISENLSSHPFDWDNIIDDYSYGSTMSQRNAVANLCYMLGVSVNMDYDPSGSGASSKDAMLALVDNFGYDSDMTMFNADYMSLNEWHSILQSELEKGYPILYSATTATKEGHAFIIDGYTPPSTSSGTPYYHINWGWEGSYNGDFAISSLIVDGWNFSDNHGIVAGIHPEDNITSCNSQWQGSVSLSQEKMRLSEVKTVSAKLGIYNAAYRTFNGSIIVKLVSPDGSRKTIQKYSASAVENGYGYNLTVNVTPEKKIGNYGIEVYSVASGKSTEDKIYLSGTTAIEIISDNEDLQNKETDLQVTSLQINTSKCTTTSLSVTLSDIINMASDSFTGTLNLAIADNSGKILNVMDNGTEISGLGQYHSLTYPRTISSTIPSGLSDGKYRLCAASCQSGYSGWSLVRKWTLSGNTIIEMDKEIYSDIWIKNSHLYLTDPDVVDGIEELVENEDTDKIIGVYSLDGRKIAPSAKGFQIIKLSNGRTIKLLKQ